MKQTDGMKVIVLTRGDLADMTKRSMSHGRKKEALSRYIKGWVQYFKLADM